MDKLISQQAAIDALHRYFADGFEEDRWWNSTHVIAALKELPSIQPDTTTHDSIPAETGKNYGDRTSGDCVSRQAAIDEIHEDAEWLASQGSDWQVERMERDKSILMSLPSVQPEQTKMIKEIREWINSGNRGSADYFIVDKIEEILNKYE